MKTNPCPFPRRLAAIALWMFVAASAVPPPPARATEEPASFGRFGTVTLYHSSPQPAHVVLFVSGDGGWNQGVVDMARELTTLDALVVGIDITHYLKELEAGTESCSYPASDFEELSKFVQKKLGYAEYRIPVLVGYSSGATLVYAILVQSPPNTFLGAMALGFCPDLLVTKPFCPGSGLTFKPAPKGRGIVFLPAKSLEAPFVALQGTIDQVCDPPETEAFIKETSNAEVVILPKVGHGYSVPRNWMPQFKQAFTKIAEKGPVDPPVVTTGDIQDLPLIEVPTADTSRNVLAIHITGDGGWGVTDKGLGKELAAIGIPVVGVNSLQYFWKERTPEETTAAIARVIRHYLAVWHKEEVVLIGYSFGADVLPILVNRLPADLTPHIRLVVLLGPSSEANFQFHITDWLGGGKRKDAVPVVPEINKIRGPKVLCFYGEGDKEAVCKDLDPAFVTSIPISGGHRIGNRFDQIVESIQKEIP
jgi:type IV secretory pathway VirJ component